MFSPISATQFLCVCIGAHRRILAAQPVFALSPEAAHDTARDAWEDQEEARCVEVWLNGAVVFRSDGVCNPTAGEP